MRPVELLRPARLSLLIASALLLGACGGGSGGGSGDSGNGSGGSGGGGTPTTFTVGGTISGLGGSTGLVLANAGDTLQVPANAMNFTMPAEVPNGASYNVTVKANPTAMQCSVISGAGTVNGADVDGIGVSCRPGSESLLYSFIGPPEDGNDPGGLLQALDGSFIGVTAEGGEGGPNVGSSGGGTVFNLTPDGTAETVLYSFPSGPTDGFAPGSILQAGDGGLYGTTYSGGRIGPGGAYCGTVFTMTPSGTAETVLHLFAGGTTDGCSPGGLIQGSDGNFYGVTASGGANSGGVVFKITPGGTETVLYSFAAGGGFASMIQGSDGNFYGTTVYGGSSGQCNPSENPNSTAGNGVVFKLTPGGTETVLHAFAGGATDGCQPDGLIQGRDGDFYGVTAGGGASNEGVVFKITPGGTETVLYSFAGGTTDGAWPASIIEASDGNFYGITIRGGIVAGGSCGYLAGNGVLFKLTPGGTETVLHSFACGPEDGYIPDSLIQAGDGDFLGTTAAGGINNDGTIWEFN